MTQPSDAPATTAPADPTEATGRPAPAGAPGPTAGADADAGADAPVRVLVAEDQTSVRAGLVLILRSAPDLRVVGEAADGEQAVALARELRPDVVLMDVQMPRLDGVSATGQIVADGLADVLVLTTFDLDEYVFGALRAGAAGFLLKDSEATELLAAVRTVARGEGLIAPSVTRRLIHEFGRVQPPGPASGPDAALLDSLTRREREVLGALGEGLSNAEIATRLTMAEATVKTHVSRLLAKLELRSRVRAAVLAQEWGVSAPPRRP
ncbi:response regulator transcription factor [Streptomyces buecherae]|uniref:response regulator transcription factor n=1 Tax=Streptomyces buecherae TaxID=2763006 RepID=UPI0033E86FCA